MAGSRLRLVLVLVTLLFAFASPVAAPARADTPATCSTDSPTSYCEQTPAGVGSGAFLSGFGIAEIGGAVLFTFLIGFHMVRRLLRAAGL